MVYFMCKRVGDARSIDCSRPKYGLAKCKRDGPTAGSTKNGEPQL